MIRDFLIFSFLACKKYELYEVIGKTWEKHKDLLKFIEQKLLSLIKTTENFDTNLQQWKCCCLPRIIMNILFDIAEERMQLVFSKSVVVCIPYKYSQHLEQITEQLKNVFYNTLIEMFYLTEVRNKNHHESEADWVAVYSICASLAFIYIKCIHRYKFSQRTFIYYIYILIYNLSQFLQWTHKLSKF